MANQTASWTLKLNDEMSDAAETAAEALKGLEAQLSASTRELTTMQKALKNLKLAASPNSEEIEKLTKRIAATKEAVADTQLQYVSLGGKFGGAAKAGRGLEARIAALLKGSKELPGPLGDVAGALDKMRKLLGVGSMAAGALALAAAITAIGVASVVATRKLYNYGVAQADAHRSEMLRLEGISKVGNAKGMMNAIDAVSAKTPTARAQVAKYAEELDALKLSGAELESALEAVSIASAVQGDASASALVKQMRAATEAGQGVEGLADTIKNDLGGTAAAMMSSLTVQAVKQKEAFDALFHGTEIDRYLRSWKGVSDLLSQSRASGRALKVIMGAVLQPLIDASTVAAPLVRQLFEGMIIAALQFVVALLAVKLWWRKTFGGPEQKKSAEDSRGWIIAGQAVLWGLVAALGVAAYAVGTLAVQLGARLVPALEASTGSMMRMGMKGLTAMGRGLVAVGTSARNAAITFGKMPLGEIASRFGSVTARAGGGFVNAMKSAGTATLAFGKSAGKAAIEGVKSLARAVVAMIPQLWAMATAAWAAVAPFLPFIAAALAVGFAIYQLIKYWDDLVLAFDQVDWGQMGSDIMQGLLDAIIPRRFADKMAELANAGIAAFKELFDFGSPSKVFAELGLDITKGLTGGVEEGSPEAQAAVTGMIDVPPVNAGSAAGGALADESGVSAARGGVNIEIGQVVVNASSAEPKQLASDFRRELERVLEALASELGARTVAA